MCCEIDFLSSAAWDEGAIATFSNSVYSRSQTAAWEREQRGLKRRTLHQSSLQRSLFIWLHHIHNNRHGASIGS